jgi:hypothetical protein
MVTDEGKVDIPSAIAEILPRGRPIRAIVLVEETPEADESQDWARLTSDQFLAGYAEADEIYDRLP